MRLSEKGYKVLVLEAGRRFRDEDFPKSNWRIGRFLFFPRLGMRGIMRLDFFRGLMVMSGAGVGGGSLVYANTLIEPRPEAFNNGTWPKGLGVEHWDAELARHYGEARRMLGVTRAPTANPADEALKDTAKRLGFGETFQPVAVGVYFGKPGETAADPFFGGDGPARKGCIQCGGCMVGCRHNAKNTLVKNYLYFAEKNGARIVAEREVRLVRPLQGGGYAIEASNPFLFGLESETYTARRVIFAGGVLGTMKLLLRCRDEVKTLPKISATLGHEVRTNGESIIGVRFWGKGHPDFSQGVAIAAGVNPDANTKIEAVRYSKGSNAMALLSMPLIKASSAGGRIVEGLTYLIRHPRRFFRAFNPQGFATNTIILLVMQSLDSKLRFALKRRWTSGFRKTLDAEYPNGKRPPRHIEAGNRFAEDMAAAHGGQAGGSVADMLGMSVTAHILGGCPMGGSDADGVIDAQHRIFNYPGLFVVGGAAVPANLGVNPSLTITAMAERAMSMIETKAVRRTIKPPET